MFTRTKIVCTIGPAVESYEKMVALIEAGMNVARLNFSHGTYEQHAKNIANLKKARQSLNRPLALMLDMQGPKIRVGKIKNSQLELKAGQRICLKEKGEGTSESIDFHPFEVIGSLSVGMKVLFDDGYIIGKVVEVFPSSVTIEIENSGILKSGKGVNLPGAVLPLPAMTEEDFEDLKFGCSHDVDFVAASFIRSSQHVLAIKDFLAQQGHPHMPVISKIECTEGLENFDSIVEVSDGIMIARGDLGVEVDLSLVPKLQKMMIRKCFQACKPVITATQMLESMISNPRPTRAEVSDVANAIYDATSAIMLSAETAVGKYPIETVCLMKEITKVAEEDFDYKAFFNLHSNKDYHDISSSVALAAVKTAYSCSAKAIFAITTSGATARLVSRLRPEMPVIAVTSNEKHYHQLAASFGVMPVMCEDCSNSKMAFVAACKYALKEKIIEFGDVVVVTAGVPFGVKGTTNMMIVENIGQVLVRAAKGFGSKVQAPIAFLTNLENQLPEHFEGKIVVLSHCDSSFMPFLAKSKAIVLQNWVGDTASEKHAQTFAKTFNIPCLTRADNALTRLKSEEIVTLDPQRKIIFKGTDDFKPENESFCNGFN